jgi:hypothetical protein
MRQAGEATEAALEDDPPSTAADAERPMSCTSGFFTKFWLGDVPRKKKTKTDN